MEGDAQAEQTGIGHYRIASFIGRSFSLPRLIGMAWGLGLSGMHDLAVRIGRRGRFLAFALLLQLDVDA